MRSTKTMIGGAAAGACLLALMLAGWATGAQAPVGSGKASATKSICGLGTGKKATGKPIKLGGIDMLIPGVDFTTIGKVADAYFKCVNDNGGINGRPIKYILYQEQLNPAQQRTLAKKLIESDKVVGIVGNTSFTECGDELEVLQVQGLHRDRRRRAGRVLRHRRPSSRRTWARATATSAPPRRSSSAARSRSSSPRRTRSRRTPTGAWTRSPRRPGSRARASRPSSR